MRKSNIIDYKNPSQNLVTDVLSEFLRESTQKMLQLAGPVLRMRAFGTLGLKIVSI